MDALEPIVHIEIDGKSHEMKPTFRVLSSIETKLNMGILAFIQKRTPEKEEESYKGVNISLAEMFTILSCALLDKVETEKLEKFILNNQVYCISKCIEFLAISFRPNSEPVDDSKKN